MNVGGRRITNAELAEIFTGMGFADVALYRASGNVMFKGASDEAAIESGLQKALDYEVRTFVRSADELAAITSPFSEEQHAPRGKLQVTFLKSVPDAATIAAALAFASDDDLLAIVGRELYWLPRTGISTSDLDHKGLHKVLGLGTTRTMGTVQNIRKKLG
ncbi:MAG: DUF1697 domain-containing protein [Proteobacteria bacterium]|nr:DUF1697 domain-containing protein [Pseudomonadota bacterium]MCP4920573.1 DUF1697 domain-containing protein [Pseudomonadota bacterium]